MNCAAKVMTWTSLVGLALTASAPAASYQLIGTTWDTDRGPSEYVIHDMGSDDISDGSDVEAIREAFRLWSCVEGSHFRFRERTDQEGIAIADLEDGINTVFWDEDGSSGVNLGPSTLGVNLGNGGQVVLRDQSDIVFNGIDHTWTATDDPSVETVDVGSIAIHEIGHWLGLGHACTDETEADCLGVDEAVMTPAYSGGVWRDPGADDIDGIHALYEQADDDDSTCEGPYRIGEFCSCDAECTGDLLCIGQDDGQQICSNTCDSENTDCGPGFNCILGEAPEEGPAPGKCVTALRGEAAQIGAVCQPTGMCGERDCTSLAAAGGERVCFGGCQTDENCPDGYVCSGIACLADVSTVGIPCAEPDPVEPDMPMGGCSNQRLPTSSGAPGLVAVVLLGGLLRQRRR